MTAPKKITPFANEFWKCPHTHTPTFSDDDCDSVGALQLPLIRYRQRELVLADLKPRHRGNSTVCILQLHAVRAPDGRTDGGQTLSLMTLSDVEKHKMF